MGMKKKKPIETVSSLPEIAVEDKIVYNEGDESCYIGVKTSKGTIIVMKKEEKTNGGNMEETSI